MMVDEVAPGRPPDEWEIVASWVEERFRDLGFDDELAVLMADQGVDWHVARGLLEKGCSHSLALLILL